VGACSVAADFAFNVRVNVQLRRSNAYDVTFPTVARGLGRT